MTKKIPHGERKNWGNGAMVKNPLRPVVYPITYECSTRETSYKRADNKRSMFRIFFYSRTLFPEP